MKLRPLTWRRWLLVPVALVAIIIVFLFPKWRDASNKGGQQPAEPFRIAGNLYYVGANDVAAFLLTGPDGHVLIDGGYPGTAALIMASIAQLGFDIKDVKVLLNSHPHFDHAGGIAELQQASGAKLWMSEGDAHIIAAGGRGDPYMGPLRFIFPLFRYPAPRVHHRFKDGDTIRLGPIALTAHITAGHTPGCTTWSFPVRADDRELRVVDVCSLGAPPVLSLGEHPEIRAEFERTFRTLRSLPVDIWVTAHARQFGRYRKFQERGQSADSAAPFIDRDGYLRYIDSAEAKLR
ncbi:MAG TPA: subclass B3 metallo-beta-lactamase [Longimicrobiales bacterium]